MIEQYKEEMEQVHVPAALLSKTKEAIKAEEEKVRAEKAETVNIERSNVETDTIETKKEDTEIISFASFKKNRRNIVSAVAAAAAVILLVGGGVIYLQNSSSSSSMGQLAGTEKERLELETMEDVPDLYKAFTLNNSESVDFEDEYLSEYKDCEEIERGDYSYRALIVNDGAHIYVRHGNQNLIFHFYSTKLDLILPMIDDYFAE